MELDTNSFRKFIVRFEDFYTNMRFTPSQFIWCISNKFQQTFNCLSLHKRIRTTDILKESKGVISLVCEVLLNRVLAANLNSAWFFIESWRLEKCPKINSSSCSPTTNVAYSTMFLSTALYWPILLSVKWEKFHSFLLGSVEVIVLSIALKHSFFLPSQKRKLTFEY